MATTSADEDLFQVVRGTQFPGSPVPASLPFRPACLSPFDTAASCGFCLARGHATHRCVLAARCSQCGHYGRHKMCHGLTDGSVRCKTTHRTPGAWRPVSPSGQVPVEKSEGFQSFQSYRRANFNTRLFHLQRMKRRRQQDKQKKYLAQSESNRR